MVGFHGSGVGLLGFGAGHVFIVDLALGGEQLWHMGIAVERDAIGPAQDDFAERGMVYSVFLA